MANYPGYNPNYFGPSYGMNQTPVQYSGSVYPQMQQSMQVVQPQQPVNQNPMMPWVDGEMAARAYSVPASQPLGQPYPLWDTNDKIIYLKTLDQFGRPMPLIKVRYWFEEQEKLPQNTSGATETTTPAVDTSNFVTKSDFDELKNELRKLVNNQNGGNRQNGGKQQ